jgi:ubiquinone/menaquinone biosynthesis C-methylase UbiE
MAQNIYDDPDFFAGYSRLGRSLEGLDGAAEWPALRALLPDLRGLRVVDLGCGFGWFCRWAREQGAAEVLGVDVSEKMLARARDTTTDPAITYLRADLERLELSEAGFDLAYSSLALHYIEDLMGLLGKVYRALVPSGLLVFSAEHPIFTAPTNPGWSVDAGGRKTWPVDSYLCEGPRKTDWLAKGIKQHRTLGTYLNLLLRLGFALAHVEEWGPTDEQIAARPALAEERQRPMFLLVAARR